MNPPTDPRRFEALVRPHLDPLFRLAYRLTGNRTNAEDLVQDVLIKIFPRYSEMSRIDNLGAWLARVMYNRFIDDTRSASRSPIYLAVDNTVDGTDSGTIDQLVTGDNPPLRDVEQSRQQQRLQAAMMKLDDDHRTILLMHDVEGYTFAELGEILDCPVGTLKSRLHRARAALRDRLKSGALPADPDAARTTAGAQAKSTS